MYYDTKAGDDELKLNCPSQFELTEESEVPDEDFESKSQKVRKGRRNEASMLQQESSTVQLSNDHRPKRAAGISVYYFIFILKINFEILIAMRINEKNSNQRKISEFISKKRSPKAGTSKSSRTSSILPSIPINDSEHCPICDRLIPNDILEIHTNACLIHNSDAAKELVEKSKQRAKVEANVKEILFQRPTRKNVAAQLLHTDSETTTCPTCGMQMTVSRLENQHKNECVNRFT